MESLRGILADLLNPEKAAESTKQMKVFKSDPQLLPSLMNIALSDGEPAIRQMAAVILRKETSKRFSGLNQADQAQLKEAIIKGITPWLPKCPKMAVTEIGHVVEHFHRCQNLSFISPFWK